MSILIKKEGTLFLLRIYLITNFSKIISSVEGSKKELFNKMEK